MELPPPSAEQQELIVALQNGHSIVVDSVAGGGKSTAILNIAKALTDNILVLTFNARLKTETREKVVALGLRNIEIHSYHSFAVKYYNKKCFNDSGLIEMLRSSASNTFEYDIIIMDEAQDMTMLYYRLVQRIIRDNHPGLTDMEYCGGEGTGSAQLALLGDTYQNIYRFKGADARFLSLTSHILPGEWKTLNLSISYRLPDCVAEFINNHMIKTERIKSQKPIGSMQYLYTNLFSKVLLNKILGLLKTYRPDDIFILAPSVRSGSEKSPLKRLTNDLSSKGYSVFAPTSDDDKLDSNVIARKIVISSYHQVKGLERKVVIVMSFDDSYFTYFNRDANPMVCTNELYVACTRALEHLIVVHGSGNGALPFLQLDGIGKYMEKSRELPQSELSPGDSTRLKLSVDDLLRHLRPEIIDHAYAMLNVTITKATGKALAIPLKIRADKTFENVSDINEVAMIQGLEHIKKGKDCPTVSELLLAANNFIYNRSGYAHKTRQITRFDWIDPDVATSCMSRMDNVAVSSRTLEFYTYFDTTTMGCLSTDLTTRIAVWSSDAVYHFVCCKKLDHIHAIHVAILGFLIKMREYKSYMKRYNNDKSQVIPLLTPTRMVCMNIITGERMEIAATSKLRLLRDMIEYIIKNKFYGGIPLTDTEFIAECVSKK